MKRLLAVLLVLCLAGTVYAAPPQREELPRSAFAAVEQDVWKQIEYIEQRAIPMETASEASASDYVLLTDEVAQAVTDSETYREGTLCRNGDFLSWQTVQGVACGYAPSLRARVRSANAAERGSSVSVRGSSVSVRGGWPKSASVAVFQPYFGLDENFTELYADEAEQIAAALQGNAARYVRQEATIDAIAGAMQQCAVTLLDSHGLTDYEKGDDCTSRANSSYLCLQTNEGLTAEDMQAVEGTYGTYYHAFYAGSNGTMQYYCVDGTAIANHMTADAPQSLLWMGNCLGMATDGLCAPLRARGVETVFGYSQSVTFIGDAQYARYFWDAVIAGSSVSAACAAMKEALGAWDPAYSYATVEVARRNHAAFPVVASTEDDYPGQGNVDAVQTVASTWTLYPQHLVTATVNEAAWGSVRVSGSTILADPAEGCYLASAEVTAGEATLRLTENRIFVHAQTDCTVAVSFAQKEKYTLTWHGGAQTWTTTVYAGDAAELPTVQDVGDYVFIGWTDTEMPEETEERPTLLQTTYLPDGNADLYALYRRVQLREDSTGTGEYVAVTGTPENWIGTYLIVCEGSGAVFDAALDRPDTVGNYRTVTIRDGVIAAEDGEGLCVTVELLDDTSYSIRTASGWYIGTSSNQNGMDISKETPYPNRISFVQDNVCIEGESGSTLRFDANGLLRRFRYSRGASLQPVNLYRKDGSGGTIYYTTAPKVCDHAQTRTERVEATCTQDGSEKVVCTLCGRLLSQRVLPATGHRYSETVVAPTCTQGGHTTHTCAVCGAAHEDAAVDALGHDYGQTVVLPTCTEGGYTLHTCSRCGENYQDAYTDALGHSYKDGKCTVCGEKDPSYQPPVDNTPKYEDFKDLPAGAWYRESVGYALANGLMNGTGDGIFQPDGALTRAMLVTILYRSAGEPSVDGLKNPFQDVADGQWYTKAVVWAAGKAIVNGTSETTFDPDASITREQIAAILHRYAGKPETKGDIASFPDAGTVSDYAKTAMAWAVEKGIIGGSDGKLDPRSNATRAQVAAILMRYLTLK